MTEDDETLERLLQMHWRAQRAVILHLVRVGDVRWAKELSQAQRRVFSELDKLGRKRRDAQLQLDVPGRHHDRAS